MGRISTLTLHQGLQHHSSNLVSFNSILRFVFAALLFCTVFLTPTASAASLLAIDYGTEGFKASLVKPGVPFDVLINKDSKRKTPSIITLRGDERAFGGEAASLATRYPKDTFSSVKLLLGHPASHPQSRLHQSIYASTLSTTARSSPAMTSSSASYPVEEVLAMQFSYAKEMAEEVAKESVRDVVVSVPGWFGIGERSAVLDALELAGLRSIGLVNDGTAAAVNYAMTRSFPPTNSYHLLYDFGSGSLRVTLVSLKSAMLPDPYSLAAKPELKNVTSVNVHGYGFDLEVGGLAFNKVIRDLMKADFESGAGKGKNLEIDSRAMAKLLKEAGRVKEVLSANQQCMARIEGLIDDIDMRASITRDQFEEGCAHLLPRFTQPIQDALNDANLTMNDIDSIIMVGGSSRVPMVENAVRAVVGEEKIAKNVNADEASVMGAALYGAGITRGFRTKDIRVQDITPFGIDVSYEADKGSAPGADVEPRRIKTHLFPSLSKLGVKKTMTFKKTQDFAIHFTYRKTGSHADEFQPDDIFETTLKGLEGAFTNLTEEAIANATIKVTVELSESNMISVQKAIVVLREEDVEVTASLNDKLKGLLGKFGGGKKEKKQKVVETDELPAEDADAPEIGDPFGDADEADQEATRAKLEELLRNAVPTNSTVKLSTATVPLDRIPMSSDEKMDARKRLREIKAAETRKLAREAARNELEAFIYRARDLINDSTFVSSSIESERKVIKEKTEAANEWLWDEADSASTKDLKEKKSELDKLVKHVTVRSTEAKTRPGLVENFKKVLSSAEDFVSSAKKADAAAEARKELAKYTATELEGLTKMAADAVEWLTAMVKKQDALKLFENAILRTVDLQKRTKEVEAELNKLRKKKAPRKPKVTTKKPKEDKEGEANVEGEADGEAKEPETTPDPDAQQPGTEEDTDTGSSGERIRDEL